MNGICVGLAGKLSVLGRATSLADYVLVGQEEVGTIRVFGLDQNHKTLNISPSSLKQMLSLCAPLPCRKWSQGGKNEK